MVRLIVTTIVFVRPDGRQSAFEAGPGQSVMEVAASNGVDGIVAACGGSAVCGTCHVFVDPADFARLVPALALEDELLDGTAVPRRTTSRLSCQIRIGDDDPNLTVHLPEYQT